LTQPIDIPELKLLHARYSNALHEYDLARKRFDYDRCLAWDRQVGFYLDRLVKIRLALLCQGAPDPMGELLKAVALRNVREHLS
jgi:hypothetical protein